MRASRFGHEFDEHFLPFSLEHAVARDRLLSTSRVTGQDAHRPAIAWREPMAELSSFGQPTDDDGEVGFLRQTPFEFVCDSGIGLAPARKQEDPRGFAVEALMNAEVGVHVSACTTEREQSSVSVVGAIRLWRVRREPRRLVDDHEIVVLVNDPLGSKHRPKRLSRRVYKPRRRARDHFNSPRRGCLAEA
jgi:hypothetical protein